MKKKKAKKPAKQPAMVKKRMPKSTQAEVLQRVAAVFTMIIEGASRPEILQYASEKWGVSKRQADIYISEAKKDLGEKTEIDKDQELTVARERLNCLWQKTLTKGDLNTALQVQREINKLYGLHEAVKVQMDLINSDPGALADQLSDDELAAIILKKKKK